MRRLLLAAGAVAILVAISGCDAADPRVTPAPTPSATPVFASDEEALAAAEAAYAAYLGVSDAILADGGRNPERVEELVTVSQLPETLATFETFRDRQLHTSGQTKFDHLALTSFSGAQVDVYVCVDVSGVRVIDAQGADVTPASRDDRVPLEVGFEVSATEPRLLLDRSEPWTGDDFCS